MFAKKNILFAVCSLLLLFLFLLDIIWGSVDISFAEIIGVLTGKSEHRLTEEIILNFRLPKSITAILAGASLSVAGLMMQTLFRNPLADPYILGISSGAGLGVALLMMTSSFLPIVITSSSWGLILAAVLGAVFVLVLVIGVSFRVKQTTSLLIVGIMFGTIASSIVSLIQYFSNPDAIKLFVIWNMGSLSAVTWESIKILLPLIFMGVLLAFSLTKRLDGMLLGDNYAVGLGVPLLQTRILIVVSTGILAGAITAFTGPIAFVGIAIPHIARGIFKTSNHRTIMPASLLLGASLMLLCDIIAQLPEQVLPINTIVALFGAPIIIWIILKRK